MDTTFETIRRILTSPLWGVAWRVFLVSLAVLWLALVFWTLKDARRRIDDGLVVAVCVATSLVFPFVGTLVYVMLRPAEYLVEARERELEMLAVEQELRALRVCPTCQEPVREDYLACPRCGRSLRELCSSCARPLEYSWKVCPYCGKSVSVRTEHRPMAGVEKRPQTAASAVDPAADDSTELLHI